MCVSLSVAGVVSLTLLLALSPLIHSLSLSVFLYRSLRFPDSLSLSPSLCVSVAHCVCAWISLALRLFVVLCPSRSPSLASAVRLSLSACHSSLSFRPNSPLLPIPPFHLLSRPPPVFPQARTNGHPRGVPSSLLTPLMIRGRSPMSRIEVHNPTLLVGWYVPFLSFYPSLPL